MEEFSLELEKFLFKIKELLAVDSQVLPVKVNLLENFDYQVKWIEKKLKNKKEFSEQELQNERELMRKRIIDFLLHSQGNEALLVKAPAGMGKSTISISAIQELAEIGFRILYLMPRHDYFKDIKESPFYKEELWHHWQSLDGKTEENEPMCRYSKTVKSLGLAGYPVIEGCKKLCGPTNDNHIARCPFRQQSKTEKMIIAGVHQHLAVGLSIDFDFVIIDENMVQSLLYEQFIPAKFLISHNYDDFYTLSLKLFELTLHNKDYSGYDILQLLYNEFDDVYKKIDDGTITVKPPQLPENIDPNNEILNIPSWYFFDLLTLLLPEYKLIKAQLPKGMSRVHLNKSGLSLYGKKPLFFEQPKVILDATGSANLISKVMGIKVQEYSPSIKNKGRIFQIANRGNNISVLQNSKRHLDDAIALSKIISENKPTINGFEKYKNVGLITYKAIKDKFEHIDEEKRLHFGGNRGTNRLIDCDCLIILGTPSPPDYDILNMGNQILLNSDENILLSNVVDGKPYRTNKLVQYQYEKDGLVPARNVSGFWNNDYLMIILESLREAEIIQSLNRTRVLTKDTDVWLLTAIPTGDELFSFAEYPDEILPIPKQVPLWFYDYIRQKTQITLNLICDETDLSYKTVKKYCDNLILFDDSFSYVQKGKSLAIEKI